MNFTASAIVGAAIELRLLNNDFSFAAGNLEPGAKIALRGNATVHLADPLNGTR